MQSLRHPAAFGRECVFFLFGCCLLVGCGGGSSGGGSNVSSSVAVPSSQASLSSSSRSSVASSSQSSAVAVSVPAPDMTLNPALPLKGTPNYQLASDWSRFLTQTTFGPTPKELARVMGMTKEAWLEEQFNTPTTRDLPLLDARFESLGWVAAPVQDDSDDGWQRDLQRSDIWWEVALW